jgi:MFS transporter, CP family, cyanate transporter
VRSSPNAARSRPTVPSPRAWTAWTVVAVVVVGLNLRAPISAVSALLEAVSSGLALSGAALSALTTLPTLCLGVFAFVGPRLRGAVGEARVIAWCAPVLLAGELVRLIPSPAALFGGTLLVVGSIGVMNVVMPALIKRWFADRYVAANALYTIMMTLGASGASAVAAPLAATIGSPWVLPLAVITVPIALLAVGVWWSMPRERSATAGRTPVPARLWRDGLAWQVTIFFGTLAMTSYFVLGWLPAVCADRAMSPAASGLVLSVSALVQAVGVLTVPVVIRWTRDQRLLSCLVALFNGAGLAGVVLAPVPVGVWCAAVVLGLGQGAGFGLAMTVIGLRSATPGVAAGLSGMVQGIGYLLAIAGPLGAGLLRSATGDWRVPLVLLLAVCVAQLVSGLGAGRARYVLAGSAVPAGRAEVRS